MISLPLAVSPPYSLDLDSAFLHPDKAYAREVATHSLLDENCSFGQQSVSLFLQLNILSILRTTAIIIIIIKVISSRD